MSYQPPPTTNRVTQVTYTTNTCQTADYMEGKKKFHFFPRFSSKAPPPPPPPSVIVQNPPQQVVYQTTTRPATPGSVQSQTSYVVNQGYTQQTYPTGYPVQSVYYQPHQYYLQPTTNYPGQYVPYNNQF